MTAPDFEIRASFRARRLAVHVPPEAETETEGEGVSIARRENREGLPEKMETGGRYFDVNVEKELVGEKSIEGRDRT